jgi:hypothetical protein
MEGVRRAHGELNIGQWRVLGELTRVEYWTMDTVGSAHGQLNIEQWRVSGELMES